MDVLTQNTLYAVKKPDADGYAGVFSSAENVRNAGFEEYEAIRPCLLADGVCVDGYVCMAKGFWDSLAVIDGECVAKRHWFGPVWGATVQSAVFGVLGFQAVRACTRLYRLQIYEIDRVYTQQAPADLSGQYGFLIRKFLRLDGSLPKETLKADYVGRYLREMREQEAYRRRYNSEEIMLILERLNAVERLKHDGRSWGLRFQEKNQTQKQLASRLSERELRIVCAAWQLRDDEEIERQIADGVIPASEVKEILAKVERSVYREHWPSCARSKKLKDYLD